MKPICVEFQAFGPYAEYEKIDFTDLSSKGLFLICGETGSGKTMILDAITYALYGKSSGNVRDDLGALRCTSADFDKDTFVKFEFEAAGVTYIFERRLERKRKNLSPAYNLLRKVEGEDWETVFENPKKTQLDEKAKEIIGLDYDQFRQVIVLPQGQFERLLTSNSEDKEKILMNIFGEDKWQKIAEYLFEDANKRKEALRAVKERMEGSLQEEGCTSIAELTLLVEQKKEAVKQLEEVHARSEFEKRKRELQEALTLISQFEELEKTIALAARLAEEKDSRKAWEKQLEAATKAEFVREVLAESEKAKQELKLRENGVQNAESAVQKASQASALATKELQEHLSQTEAIEAIKKQQVTYQTKREDYQKIEAARSAVQEQKRLCNAEEDKVAALSGKSADIEQKLVVAKVNYDKLVSEHEQLLAQYLAGITGELAAKLEEGKPCPVCGSTTHPQKAVTAAEPVSKEMVEAAKEAADKQYKKMNEVIEAQNKAKAELDAQNAKVTEAKTALALCEERRQAIENNMIPDIASLTELESLLKKLELQVTQYESRKQQLEQQDNQAKETYTQAKTMEKTAREELEKAKALCVQSEDKLELALHQNGFTDAEAVRAVLLTPAQRSDLQKQMSDYDTKVENANERIEELKTKLAGKEAPKRAECEACLQEIDEAVKQYERGHGALETDAMRLAKKLREIQESSATFEQQIKEAEADFVFAKKLRGDTGTGLQRYVLGIMFSTVISAANKMLELVYDGRYRLFRSDERVQGSNKRGLELKVFDKYSPDPEGRFVNTLSGGEKFLASLALSIGMSTIAQRGGIKIEALFIDEGFGSLDENSIVDAMNILNSIQRANGMVGIISHVQLLQERIPTKLQVSKADGRSHITQTIG